MPLQKHIPNIITLLNLFCGCVAIVYLANSNFLMAFSMVCLGIFFDFFDGFFARLLKVSSPLGLQLDSLADIVTSGVVPGFMMYKLLSNAQFFGAESLLPYLGFIITLGACYRLANFNIDTRQTDSFIGLPTPANALFFLVLPLIIENFSENDFMNIIFNKYVLVALTFLSAYIMNAEIPLFSLKIKSFDMKDNKLPIIFLGLSAVIIGFFHFLGVALVIIFYVLLSVILNFMHKKMDINA